MLNVVLYAMSIYTGFITATVSNYWSLPICIISFMTVAYRTGLAEKVRQKYRF